MGAGLGDTPIAAPLPTNPRIDWREVFCPACGRTLVYEVAPPTGNTKIGLYRCRSGHSVAVQTEPVWLAA